MKIAKPLTELTDALQQLPGIGPKSAERLTFYLLRMPTEKVKNISSALLDLKENLDICQECFNVSESNLCAVCQDSDRDQRVLLVVEEPLDMIAVEKTGKYNGLYHILGGVIDPIKGIGAKELRMKELVARIKRLKKENDSHLEVILATNPSTEGETTAIYLRRMLDENLESGKVQVTRIARGLPVGGDLEYADPMTLSRSLEGRTEY